MREIKFRAWDAKKKMMFFADELKNLWSMDQEFWGGKPNNPHIIAIKQSYRGKDHETEINPENENTIMQYTGLKDKNGKEIFEGDLIECYPEFDGHFTVEFKRGMYGFQHELFESLFEWQVEVIGNIYEGQNVTRISQTAKK